MKAARNGGQRPGQQPTPAFTFPAVRKRHNSVGKPGAETVASNANNPQGFAFPVLHASDSKKTSDGLNIKSSDFPSLNQGTAKSSEAKLTATEPSESYPSETNSSSHAANNVHRAASASTKPIVGIDTRPAKPETQGNDFDQAPALPLQPSNENPSDSPERSASAVKFSPLIPTDSDGKHNVDPNEPNDSAVESYTASKIDKKPKTDGNNAGTRRVASASEANMPLPAFEPVLPPRSASPRHIAKANQRSGNRDSSNAVDSVDELSAFEDIPIDESVGESLRYGGAHKPDQADSGKPRWWKLLLVGVVVFVVEFVVLNLLF